MKKIALILSLLLAICSFAVQAQYSFSSDSVANKNVKIYLAGKYHGLTYELMSDRGTTEAINYVNQVARIAKSGGRHSFDTAQVMAVTVPYKLVASIYYSLSTRPEGITAKDNAEMKIALMKDLSSPEHKELALVIYQIDEEQKRQREEIRQAGINKIWSIEVF